MASKSQNPKQRDEAWYKSLPGAKNVQFVQYELSDDERKDMKRWIDENIEEFPSLTDKLLDSGFSISCKPDVAHQCIAAFLVPVGEENPYRGWILSGRASGGLKALMGVYYRHLVLFEGTWPTDGANRYRLDDE